MADDDGLDLFDDPDEEGEGTPPRRRADTAASAPGRRGYDPDEEDASVDELFDGRSDDDTAGVTTSKRKRRWPLVFLAIVLALLLAVVGAIAYYIKSINVGMDNVDRAQIVVQGTRPPSVETGAQTFVLVGSDSRGWDRGRSDTLMVAYLPANREKLYLISFLRDMWVTIPANDVVKRDSKAKINAAYSWGGMPLTIKVLEGLTDVKMDHGVVIDFNGFKKLSSDLGGIQVYNPQEFDSLGHHFDKGNVTLEGDTALAYVHERKTLRRGDLDRAANERAVLSAMIDKIFSKGTLANPSKFSNVMSDVGSTMTVDDALTNKEVRKLATSLKFDSGEDIVPLQAPIKGFDTSKDGQQYDVVDEAGMQELAQAMRTDTMDEYAANHPA
ncbi:LytR family transcriptional regulator [Cutibacterium sp. WCA-380-WT-3A]|uniref:LytR family transcriptional regulator n=1 Tax=Cutibacterium porci TaxID=2605781 RepID=A0A7K0J872_9ACTN|nr:LCP family protein [Cutibacterium porci]MSS46139.1 LytR family transcriptional regulator [Cutibacterium porci]